eukprot:191131_1
MALPNASPTFITNCDTKKPLKRQEIHKGTLFLKNRVKKKWKERYVVLYNDRRLSYWSNEYEFEQNNPAKTCIDLSLTQNIEIVENDNDEIRDNNKNIVKSPSDSLSRKGSMDFGRIFSHKFKKKDINNSIDDDNSLNSEYDRDKSYDIHNNNNNRFVFKIIQTKKTYIFSIINDKQLFKQWINKCEYVIFGNILYKGYLFQLSSKKDKKTKMDEAIFYII